MFKSKIILRLLDYDKFRWLVSKIYCIIEVSGYINMDKKKFYENGVS